MQDHGTNRTVLVVDDCADDVLLICAALRKAGFNHRLESVESPEEAVSYLKGEGRFAERDRFPFPALLLLDHAMPNDGVAVLEWVRQQPELSGLPVVVLTGSQDPGHEKRSLEAGANAFYAKPCDFLGFVETVREIGDNWLPGGRSSGS